MENIGVEPDIDVPYLPEVVQKGGDAQIDRAVAELMQKIKNSPKRIPDPPSHLPDER
jgi:C-terminal processing protease CtpA/Prc